MTALHIFILGRVQGVGFRWFVERQAAEHGVDGYVRNLSDGRVEVWAQGDRAVLDAFVKKLEVGPRPAEVDDVNASEVDPDPTIHGFHTRY